MQSRLHRTKRLSTARRTDTHTYMGRTSRTGEGVESKWYYVGQQVGRGGVDFLDEIYFPLVREVVTFASGINS
jgi:hypothetical protein